MGVVLSIAVGISVGKIINKLICKPYYDKERNKKNKEFHE